MGAAAGGSYCRAKWLGKSRFTHPQPCRLTSLCLPPLMVFPCDQCPKVCKSSGGLKQHITAVHQQSSRLGVSLSDVDRHFCQGRPRWLVLGRMSVRSGRQLSCQGSRSMGILLPLTDVTLYRPESSSRVEGRGRENTRRDRAEKSGSQGSKYQRLD